MKSLGLHLKLVSHTTVGQAAIAPPRDLEPFDALTKRTPFEVDQLLLQLEKAVRDEGATLSATAVQTLQGLTAGNKPWDPSAWTAFHTARRILNPLIGDPTPQVPYPLGAAQQKLDSFILNQEDRFIREPLLVQDLKPILLREGLKAFETWLKFDWMFERTGDMGELKHKGLYWNIYVKDGLPILIITTHEGESKRDFMAEQYAIDDPVMEMFAEVMRKGLKRIGIESFQTGYSPSVIGMREKSKIALESVQKIHGAAHDDFATIMDNFLQLAEMKFFSGIQLQSPFSLEDAERIVGQQRNPFCVPFILWGTLHHGRSLPLSAEDASWLSEIYSNVVQPFFEAISWVRLIEAITRAYSQSSNRARNFICYTLLHHFLPAIEGISYNDHDRWSAAGRTRTALGKMVEAFRLGGRNEDLKVVYARLRPT